MVNKVLTNNNHKKIKLNPVSKENKIMITTPFIEIQEYPQHTGHVWASKHDLPKQTHTEHSLPLVKCTYTEAPP